MVKLMKALTAVALVLSLLSGCGKSLYWDKADLQYLKHQAQNSPKPVLIYASQKICQPCRVLEKDMRKPELNSLFQEFLLTRMEMQENNTSAITQTYAIVGAPTLLVLDSDGNERDRITGYSYTPGASAEKSRNRMMRWLKKQLEAHENS